jgi:hypothetical protein
MPPWAVAVPVPAPAIISGHASSIVAIWSITVGSVGVGTVGVRTIPIIGVIIVPVVVISGIVAAPVIPGIIPAEAEVETTVSPVPSASIAAPTMPVIAAAITAVIAPVAMAAKSSGEPVATRGVPSVKPAAR